MRGQPKKHITNKDIKVFEALCDLHDEQNEESELDGIGPTQIGLKVGRDRYDASAYCNSSLKKLIEFNYVMKTPRGKYIPIRRKA